MAAPTVSDIADFILACLDDLDPDEHHLHGCDSVRTLPPFPCNCGEPARIQTDIATKRRIVEWCTRVIDEEPPEIWYQGRSPVDVARRVLEELALMHADHPDYRPEEWDEG
jgi:hypothetical protein